jgi:hypothetical protein
MCFWLLAVALVLMNVPHVAGAQPATSKVPRMGFLGVTSAAGYARQVEAMRQGFRDLGYVEDKNIVRAKISSPSPAGRRADTIMLPALAGELFRLQPDVNVTSGPGTRIVMPDTPRREACPGAAADSSADWSIVLAEVVALGDAAVVPPVQTAPLQHRHHQIHELLDRAR